MKGLQQRIQELRQQPHEVRLRQVSLATGLCGVLLLAIWGLVLLPMQLAFNRGDQAEETGELPGAVSGLRTNILVSPSPTAIIPMANEKQFYPSPEIVLPSPSISPLPLSEDKSSATTANQTSQDVAGQQIEVSQDN